jgi:hypothetical protein
MLEELKYEVGPLSEEGARLLKTLRAEENELTLKTTQDQEFAAASADYVMPPTRRERGEKMNVKLDTTREVLQFGIDYPLLNTYKAVRKPSL